LGGGFAREVGHTNLVFGMPSGFIGSVHARLQVCASVTILPSWLTKIGFLHFDPVTLKIRSKLRDICQLVHSRESTYDANLVTIGQ